MKFNLSHFVFDPRFLMGRDDEHFFSQAFKKTRVKARHIAGVGKIENARAPEWPGWQISSWHALAPRQGVFTARPTVISSEAGTKTTRQLDVIRVYSFDEQYLAAFTFVLHTATHLTDKILTQDDLNSNLTTLLRQRATFYIGDRNQFSYAAELAQASDLVAALHYCAVTNQESVKHWLSGNQFRSSLFRRIPSSPEPPVRLVRMHPVVVVHDDQKKIARREVVSCRSPKVDISTDCSKLDDPVPVIVLSGDAKDCKRVAVYMTAFLAETWSQFCTWELVHKEHLRTKEQLERAASLIEFSEKRINKLERHLEKAALKSIAGIFHELADDAQLGYLEDSEAQLLTIRPHVRKRIQQLKDRLQRSRLTRSTLMSRDEGNSTSISIAQHSYGSNSPNVANANVDQRVGPDTEALAAELRQLVLHVQRLEPERAEDLRLLAAASDAAKNGDSEKVQSLLARVGIGAFKYVRDLSLPIASAFVARMLGIAP